MDDFEVTERTIIEEMPEEFGNVHQDVDDSHVEKTVEDKSENDADADFQIQIPSKDPVVKKRSVKNGKNYTSVSILSLNVWGGDVELEYRINQILNLIKKERFDIICFQEISQKMYISFQKILSKRYAFFQQFINENLDFGECILCNRETCNIVEAYFYNYNMSTMSKKLLGCEVRLKEFSEPFHVMNTQLESGASNDSIRVQQLQTVQKILTDNQVENVLLCGDFNIVNGFEKCETVFSQSGLKDCWVEMGCPVGIKFTVNSQTNPRIKSKNIVKNRSDRVAFKTTRDSLVKSFQLVGTETPTLSDHYGISCEIIFSK